ncbi:hypothetical protein GALMADRAFT_239640 [Galerina marginata CBS 339.88]|uniref:SET domain-containing protein n=1 Tax=Galerina marginata (strain CBS 339.88) TaxID=685588 RepID=A0A067TRJ7_GALM3|nr:hypothetical protein GALMADRAFT_239640 [Galerina marginata CBS 339.88]
MSPENLPVVARSTSSPGAGYGLFALQSIEPSKPLFSIPAKALLNSLTLAPHYPPTKPRLTCTQFVSLHLMLHRPSDGHKSFDPLFGPYISVLPRRFDFHPLTWLWKRRRNHETSTLENRLMQALPPRILAKLHKISNLFDKDWERVQKYLGSNPALHEKGTSAAGLEADYLWGWLNVNTRCVYHRLAKTRSDQDNMTLCPILDFANHTTTPPYTLPQATHAELWDTGPSTKRKFGDDFVLLSPSTASSSRGGELFLRYGAHSNATLFAEYGFVNLPSPEWTHDEASGGEVELGHLVEDLFRGRAEVGSWMKEVLVEEGYWGDWTIHSLPAPAYPSYRLITTLRLYHILPMSANSVPVDTDQVLQEWRDTTLGKRDVISQKNESLWRATLKSICSDLITEARQGVQKISLIKGTGDSPMWIDSARTCVDTLWKEEIDVATAVVKSLEENAEF